METGTPSSRCARPEPLVRARCERDEAGVVRCDPDAEARGSLTVLMGPSGSGKTTVLTLIGCLRAVQAGHGPVCWAQELNGADRGAAGDAAPQAWASSSRRTTCMKA